MITKKIKYPLLFIVALALCLTLTVLFPVTPRGGRAESAVDSDNCGEGAEPDADRALYGGWQ
jgi:hypothetical protein